MTIHVRDLHEGHPVVRAAIEMVKPHAENKTMLPTLEEIGEKYPSVPRDYLICIWIGINAKDREGLD